VKWIKHTTVYFALSALLLTLPGILHGQDQSSESKLPPDKTVSENQKEEAPSQAVPSAHFPELNYEFEAVAEGINATHDFIVQNKGNADLKIKNVSTGCSCTVASYPRQIPAGGEGRISVKVSTNGYGGKTVRRTVVVSTNDPKQPKVNINIGGKVNKFAEISPQYVHLTGDVGEKIASDMTIVPDSEYTFKIKKVKAKKNEFINFNLVEPTEKEPDKYTLHVENTKPDAGRYADVIQLITDSKIQPVMTIGVYGYIKDKKADTPKEKSPAPKE
jgi:hypothetical protein